MIDFPRLMLRSLAIQHVQAKVPASARSLAHRPAGQARHHVRATGQPHEPCGPRPQRDGEGHRHRQGPAAPDVRARAFLEVVPRSRLRHRRWSHATRHPLPHVPRGVPGPVDRQGDGRRLRAERCRVRAARGPGVLRHAVARRGRRRQVPRGGRAQRGRPRAAGARGQGHRRAAADLRLRAQEGVQRLPRHRRRPARRRAHLRHVGVPPRAPPRATARHRVRRHHLRIDPLAGGVPLPRAADRPEEQAADGAHRRQGQHDRTVLSHRRHLGAPRREHGDGEAGGEAADGEDPRVHRRVGRRRLSSGEHRDQGRHRHDAVASPPGDGPRLRDRGCSEKADRRRHRGSSARTRKNATSSARTSST